MAIQSQAIIKDYEYFIMIAEELNITKAAKRAYVSQQALSKYIMTLEDYYGVKLIERKPVMKLTMAGEIFLKRAYQFRQISSLLKDEMHDIQRGISGQFNFSIALGRSFAMIPKTIDKFVQYYPQVKVNIGLHNTAESRELVLKGEMDAAMGISPQPAQGLIIEPLFNESLFLAINENMLKRYFPNEYPNCKLRFQNGVNLKEFENIPFSFNSSTTHIKTTIINYLEKNNINLKFLVDTGSNELNINLTNSLACFCMQFLIPTVVNHNKNTDNPINIFPIIGLNECNQVSLMYLENNKKPSYFNFFLEEFKKALFENVYFFDIASKGENEQSALVPYNN